MTQLMGALVTMPHFVERQPAVTIRPGADGVLGIEPAVVCYKPEFTEDGTDFGVVELSSPFAALMCCSQADGTDDGYPCTRFSLTVPPEAESVINATCRRSAGNRSGKMETVVWPQGGGSEAMTVACLTQHFACLLRTLPLARLKGEPVTASPAAYLGLRAPCPVNPYASDKTADIANCRWRAQNADVLSVVPFYPGQPDNPYGFAVTDRLGRRYFVPVLPHFALVKKRRAVGFELGFFFAPLHEDGSPLPRLFEHLYAVRLARGVSEAALLAQIPMWRQRICVNLPPAGYRPTLYAPAFDRVMANTVFSSVARLVPERLTEGETEVTAALLAHAVTRRFPQAAFADWEGFSVSEVAFTVKEGMPEALAKGG